MAALVFLRDHSPHSISNPIDTMASIGMRMFAELAAHGLATGHFGHGNVQFSISEAGRRAVMNKEPST